MYDIYWFINNINVDFLKKKYMGILEVVCDEIYIFNNEIFVNFVKFFSM